MKKYVDKDKLQEFAQKLTNKQKTIFATKSEVGSPLKASTVAEMTDTNRIYVYTGSESGYTSGNWYYYDGSAWTSGGIYNAVAVDTDTTLAVPGKAADAKAVGDALANVEIEVDATLTQAGKAADAKAAGDAIGEVEGDVTNLKEQLNDLVEIATSKNLFNSTLIRGNVSSAGVVNTNPDGTSTRTDFIAIEPGTYIASYIDSTIAANIAVYVSEFQGDANKTFIKRTNVSTSKTYTNPFTLDSNTAFIIIHWTYTVESELSNIQIEAGSTITPYQPFEYIVKKEKVEDYEECLENVATLKEEIKSTLSEDNTNFTTPNNTVFDITLRPSKYIAANGTISDIANTHYKVSNYIDVSDIDKVTASVNGDFSHGLCAFYDADYNVVSVPLKANSGGTVTSYTDEEINVPANAKYIVIAGIDQLFNPTAYYVNGFKLKKWTGLKWAAVGDSLTEVNVRTTMHYHDYIAQETGITVVNMGRSGTGYKRQYEDNLAFYQRIASVPTDSDVVTIFGSGNDQLYYSDSDMGTATDVFDADNPASNTLGACINHTIDVLYSIIPTVQLGIIAPCPWTNYNPVNHNNGMAKYTELLREICYNRSIPFLDMYHESNLRPWDATFRELAYSKDEGSGTHPDETGHKLMAGRFRLFLDSLLGITDKPLS